MTRETTNLRALAASLKPLAGNLRAIADQFDGISAYLDRTMGLLTSLEKFDRLFEDAIREGDQEPAGARSEKSKEPTIH